MPPPLTWTRHGSDTNCLHGYQGRLLVAQVVRYDSPAGWQGFITGNRVPGVRSHPTAEAAQQHVEAWLAENGERPTR